MATGMKMQPAKLDTRFVGLPLLRSLAVAGFCGLLSGPSWAQEGQGAGARSGSTLRPRLSVAMTLTDNLRLSQTHQDRALITTVSPGLNLSSRSGSLRGSLDYALNGLIYTKTSQADQVQHTLSAQATLEAVPNRFYVDGRASVGQQAISAFGVAGTDPSLINSNRTELAMLSLSPHVRGELAGRISYELRADASVARAKKSQVGDISSTGASVNLRGTGDSKLLNWAVNLRSQQLAPRYGRETQIESATASLIYRPDVDWSFSTTAGRERSDLQSLSVRTGPTYGLGANWSPSPRTSAKLDWKHRVYGDTHALGFEHRMARSVWRVSDSRSVTQGVLGAAGLQNNYELLFLQFASIEPDPVKRDLLVRQYLQNNGLSAGSAATAGFLTGSTSLTRRQEASMSWQGQRSTLTFSLSQSRSRRLDARNLLPDDFSQSSLVRQRGYALSVSHKLTPINTLSAVLSQQQSRGDTGTLSTDLKSITANWNGRLARSSSIQLGLRHSSFESVQRSYRENALLVTLVQQF